MKTPTVLLLVLAAAIVGCDQATIPIVNHATGPQRDVTPGTASIYMDQTTFEQAAGSGLTLIDFATRDDGSPISSPTSDLFFAALTLRGVTFDSVQSYWNGSIYTSPPHTIHVNLPSGTVAFGTQLFPFYGTAGTFTIRLSTGQVVQETFVGATPTVSWPAPDFFAAIADQPIAWVEFSFDTDDIMLDNFEFRTIPVGGPVTAAAGGGSATYDGTPKAPHPACAVTGPITGDLTCANNPINVGPNAGTYAITPVVSGTNLSDFAVTSVPGTYTINKASQTIGFTPDLPDVGLVDKNNNAAPFKVSASSFYWSPPAAPTSLGIGLQVTFLAGGQCTVSNPSSLDGSTGVSSATVTLTGVGSCTITISQGGNGNYNPAADVSKTFPVVRSFAMGPQAMEGDLKVPMGATLEVGYDFTIPGAHAAETVSFSSAFVAFPYTCVAGPSTPTGETPVGSGTITIPIADASLAVPANSSAWYPSGNQSDPAVFQGSLQLAIDLCTSSGLVRLQKGGTFTTGIASDRTAKVNIRWHYRANGSAGGWSGTLGVIPN